MPEGNGAEAALVEGIEVCIVKTFGDLVEYLGDGDYKKAPIAKPIPLKGKSADNL